LGWDSSILKRDNVYYVNLTARADQGPHTEQLAAGGKGRWLPEDPV